MKLASAVALAGALGILVASGGAASAATGSVSIGDEVWIDRDGDGVRGEDDEPLSFVQIKLYDEFGELVGETMTDATGRYVFSDLAPSTIYTIAFPDELPIEGETHVLVEAGQGGDDEDSTPEPDGFFAFTTPAEGENSVAAGEADDATIDAGYVLADESAGDEDPEQAETATPEPEVTATPPPDDEGAAAQDPGTQEPAAQAPAAEDPAPQETPEPAPTPTPTTEPAADVTPSADPPRAEAAAPTADPEAAAAGVGPDVLVPAASAAACAVAIGVIALVSRRRAER